MTSEYTSDIEILLTHEYANTRWNTIAALIRGIRDPDRIRALLEAEANHQQRQGVIAHLNQRKQLLEKNPDLSRPIEELPTIEDQAEYDIPDTVFLDRDGNEYERSSVDSKIQELTAEASS